MELPQTTQTNVLMGLASAAQRSVAGMKDADFGGLIVCSVKKVAIALTDMLAFAA